MGNKDVAMQCRALHLLERAVFCSVLFFEPFESIREIFFYLKMRGSLQTDYRASMLKQTGWTTPTKKAIACVTQSQKTTILKNGMPSPSSSTPSQAQQARR
jgi:hypothetical protein